MVQQVAGADEPGDGGGQKSSRRVRYLQDEAAPSAPRMVLGDALCKQREALGLQQQEVAFRLGLSRSKVSRIESGHVRSKERDLNSLFALYEIHDPREQTMLRSLAQDASKPVWWQRWSSVAPRYLQAVVSFEDMAQRIRSYEPQGPGVCPGRPV
ncbi:helix-turn-helix domain-containing protein [Streptomyces acidiscabies]|uniref:helix-turn-helix domain-containing protein n=1 Tax=Streptomyces acidiscabies TaxID=42234 RepID=UPI0009A0AD40|nr:helix-turn-helix transcriptional regulator [Streptomyces acidiscabies]